MSMDLKVYLSNDFNLTNQPALEFVDYFQALTRRSGDIDTVYSIMRNADYVYPEDSSNEDMAFTSYVLSKEKFESDLISSSELKNEIMAHSTYNNNQNWIAFQLF